LKLCYPDSSKTGGLFLQFGLIFQQDGAPAHTEKLVQDFLATNCSEFIDTDEWPPNSPDLNPLDYHNLGSYNVCLNATRYFIRIKGTSKSWRISCR